MSYKKNDSTWGVISFGTIVVLVGFFTNWFSDFSVFNRTSQSTSSVSISDQISSSSSITSYNNQLSNSSSIISSTSSSNSSSSNPVIPEGYLLHNSYKLKLNIPTYEFSTIFSSKEGYFDNYYNGAYHYGSTGDDAAYIYISLFDSFYQSFTHMEYKRTLDGSIDEWRLYINGVMSVVDINTFRLDLIDGSYDIINQEIFNACFEYESSNYLPKIKSIERFDNFKLKNNIAPNNEGVYFLGFKTTAPEDYINGYYSWMSIEKAYVHIKIQDSSLDYNGDNWTLDEEIIDINSYRVELKVGIYDILDQETFNAILEFDYTFYNYIFETDTTENINQRKILTSSNFADPSSNSNIVIYSYPQTEFHYGNLF